MEEENKILEAITANKPAFVALPQIDLANIIQYDDSIAQFKRVLESIGGKLIETNELSQLQQEIENEKRSGKFIVNTVKELGEVDDNIITSSAHQLEAVDNAYIKGSLGIAENGAVWVNETNMLNRLLPFICQHLVLIVERANIVATMHHAYQQIDTFEEGFGVFIAGPSKTADIEQSLVIGAHGARSLVVYII